MKKILLVNASPRKGGNCDVATQYLAEKLPGCDVTVFNMREKDCHPCQACAVCQGKTTQTCVQKDDIAALLPLIDQCDAIVLASPIYNHQINSQAKLFIERFYPFFFEHLKKWKEEGKVRHIGFSFHSNAETLAKILDDHPEVEFVQLAVNYIDWESQLVQARACYDVARARGKRVIIMEPVKGGALAALSPDAAARLRQAAPARSIVSWAFRFLADLDGVITILSGMSTPAQMADNITTFRDLAPLSEAERAALDEAIRCYRDSGPIALDTIARYEGLTYHDVPATALLETYNICQLQPVPNFTDDCNYLKNALAEWGHRDLTHDEDFPPETVTLADGTDGTPLLRVCEHWLRRNTLG